MKATIVQTTDVASVSDAVVPAIEAVGDGKTIVIPTDTVYGIAADAFSVKGVEALLAAKGRTRQMPPPVLIYDASVLAGLADGVSKDARALADAFWPGALTLIFYAQPSLNWDLGDTQGTVALRVPDDKVAIELLMSLGPLAVSSANKTGRPAATTAEEAAAQLGNDVEVIVDAGPRPLNRPADFESQDALPSTIVDCTSDRLIVVREGAIPVANLRAVVPSVMTRAEYEAQENAQREALAATLATSAMDLPTHHQDQDPNQDETVSKEPEAHSQSALDSGSSESAEVGVSANRQGDSRQVVSVDFAAGLVQAASADGIDQERPLGSQSASSDLKGKQHLPVAAAAALVFGTAPRAGATEVAESEPTGDAVSADYGRGGADEEFSIDDDFEVAFAEPFEGSSPVEEQVSDPTSDDDDAIEYPEEFEEVQQSVVSEEPEYVPAADPVKPSRRRKKSSRRK